MKYACVKSSGVYVPEEELPNSVLQQRFSDNPDFVEKMAQKSGIYTRWRAPKNFATSDMAAKAGEKAIAAAGLKPEDISIVIVGTDSPDYITPSTSVITAHKLGAKNAGTFDVGCACSSFPSAFSIASGLMAANTSYKYILVIGAYLMSRFADEKDIMSFFYGDGAGAVVLEAKDTPGFIASSFLSDGSYAMDWGIYAGGTVEPASSEAIAAGRTQVKMLNKYPPSVNEDGWPKIVNELAERGNFELSDVSLFIFTQVRKRTIEKVMQKLEIPWEKTHCVMEKWGYTGSACIPMALHDALEEKKAKTGDLVVLVGSGVGYNQAGTAFRL
ncbi:3-oxoacyl-ACP synthase III family protein [Candidatus Uabimicrobium sp. HlEnr_7]|uniref:3-oxoacyl-ACP synthase III family protein n=1 Tax=Candidatus Uabimicrobium helgolandensis TaxID=3095367 RepID=UPI003556D7A4